MDLTQEQIKAEIQKLTAQANEAAADVKLGILQQVQDLKAKLHDATE